MTTKLDAWLMLAMTPLLPIGLLLGLSTAAQAQIVMVDSYCTLISAGDRVSSSGAALNDVGTILQQDRANFHRFGKADAEDEADTTFATPEGRERLPQMAASGFIPEDVANAILHDEPNICVEIYGAQWVDVMFAGDGFADGEALPYPFEGRWDCEVATFTFTPATYSNGSETFDIAEIQEGTDGSYTLFIPDAAITLSGFEDDTMGWFSHASGDSFNCNLIQ